MTDTTQEELPPLPDECYKYERLINAMHEWGRLCIATLKAENEKLRALLPALSQTPQSLEDSVISMAKTGKVRLYDHPPSEEWETWHNKMVTEIAELKKTIGILAEEKEADICRANSAESNLSAAKELLREARSSVAAVLAGCKRVDMKNDEIAQKAVPVLEERLCRIDAFLQEKL